AVTPASSRIEPLSDETSPTVRPASMRIAPFIFETSLFACAAKDRQIKAAAKALLIVLSCPQGARSAFVHLGRDEREKGCSGEQGSGRWALGSGKIDSWQV